GRLFHRILYPLDVRKLRADMEMQQLEHVNAAGVLELANDVKDLSGGEPELSSLTSGFFPLAGTFRIELYPNTDHGERGVGGILRDLIDQGARMIALAHLLDHDNDILAGRGTCECQTDEIAVFEAVQDEQTVL